MAEREGLEYSNTFSALQRLTGQTDCKQLQGLTIWLSNFSALPIWVAHDQAKRPFDPKTGGLAKSNDPSTWGLRIDAEMYAGTRTNMTGVGVQLGPLPGASDWFLCGVDLDSCFNPNDRTFAPHAEEIIARLSSYTEISQSGRGAKVLFIASRQTLDALPKPKGKRRQWGFRRGDHDEVTLSCDGRFFAITEDETGPEPEIFEMTGKPTPLRIVDKADLLWLIEEAAPAYQGKPEKPKRDRDESGSAQAFRFLRECAANGMTEEAAREAIERDSSEAGDWWSRTDDRQRERAWENARKSVQAFAEMNKRHAVVTIGGRTKVATFKPGGEVDFGGEGDLHSLYANRFLTDENGKRVSLSRAWMASGHRRTYANGIVFAPGEDAPGGTLNLWKGWRVEPDANADCSLYLAHLRDVVCQGDEAAFDYLVKYLAHIVQRPAEKPGVAIVLRGGKGVGKDTVAAYFSEIVGHAHAPVISQNEQLTGRFNSHLQTALFVRVEEAVWAGSRRDEGALKSLITAPEMTIERKGVDIVQARSFVRVFISANAEWAVPASADERRFFVLNLDQPKEGPAYFEALYREMRGRGPGALLHMLREVDLSSFDVRAVPSTQGLTDQKIASLRNVERWWFERLHEGRLLTSATFEGRDWEESPAYVDRDFLRDDYELWMRDKRFQGEPVDLRQFGIVLRRLCSGVEAKRPRENGVRTWKYALPDLGTCRQLFVEWMGSPVAWEEADNEL